MPHDARLFDSFGCQAMTKADIFHVVVQENSEDELEGLTIFQTQNAFDFSWLDVIFEIYFELLKPPQEIFNSALEFIL